MPSSRGNGAASADPGARPGRFDLRRPLDREIRPAVPAGFSFAAVGDCILSRPLAATMAGDADFARVIALLRSADLRYGNLETTIVDLDTFTGSPYSWDADWTLASHPGVARDLAELGLQLVSRANNHALDWGADGMAETSRRLDEAGVVHAGVGRHSGLARGPRYLDLPQGRVGLVSFASTFRPTSDALPYCGAAPGRPGVSALAVETTQLVERELFAALTALGPDAGDVITRFGVRFAADDGRGVRYEPDENDLADILKNIRLAAQHSDFVIAALHAHQAENEWESGEQMLRPAAFVTDVARAAIDAGAAAFVTTGNHNVGGIEIYRGKPIFTGLGNFFWSDIQEPLSAELRHHPANRRLLAETFKYPDRVTDADLSAIVNATGGFANDFTFETTVPRAVYESTPDGEVRLSELAIYPVSLRYGERLTKSGIPAPAGPQQAKKILEDVMTLSPTVDIEIVVDDNWVHGRVTPRRGG
jgi:poly-gamma-glutamate capsule biosynthesis protein CapA/YwtB (metallophosphatase superfamily)